MTWEGRLLTGSFRGVVFQMEAARVGGGHRVAVHEFPGSEKFATVDVGRRARTFGLRCFVVGEDYLDQRDKLMKALEKKGEGPLIHPTQGILKVVVGAWRVVESSQSLGTAEFEINFVQAAPEPFAPVAPFSLLRSKVDESSKGLMDGTADVLEDTARVDGVPEFVREAAVNELETVIGELDSSIRRGSIDLVADFVHRAARVVDRGLDLLSRPRDLAFEVQALISEVEGVIGSRRETLRILLEWATRKRPIITGASFMQRAAEANAQAVSDLVAVSSLAIAARVAVRVDWESREEALEARTAIDNVINSLETDISDELFLSLHDLRSQVSAAIPPPSRDLPHLEKYTPPETLPSLVLTHRIYGSIEHEADLIARNNISNPALVPGGQELEVLVRD